MPSQISYGPVWGCSLCCRTGTWWGRWVGGEKTPPVNLTYDLWPWPSQPWPLTLTFVTLTFMHVLKLRSIGSRVQQTQTHKHTQNITCSARGGSIWDPEGGRNFFFFRRPSLHILIFRPSAHIFSSDPPHIFLRIPPPYFMSLDGISNWIA